MVSFTRRHYLKIGGMLKKLPKKQKKTLVDEFDAMFRADNPRYKSSKFKDFVGE